ncbi:MAG: DUF3568 family protein [Crenarchaeota archaeon]|nr:MAG: DUF3568 family protein [Thermoproteota archaeon]
MKNLFKIIVLLGIFSILIPGCGPSAFFIGPAVSGVIYWVNGEAHKYYEEDAEVVYRASKHALHELNIPITQDYMQDEKFYITAGEDNRFSLKIVREEQNNLSRLSIRINYIGDKDFAELIYKEVDDQLNIIYFDDQGDPTKRKNLRWR